MEVWQVVALALGTGLAGVITGALAGGKALVEQIFEVWRMKVVGSAMSPIQALEFNSELNSVLVLAKEISNVERVVSFVGHNNRGLPKDGCTYTVRAQTGWAVKDGTPAYPLNVFGFDLVIDEPYAEMLLRCNRLGYTVETTDKMPVGLLRSIYESEGVKSAILYRLHRDTATNSFCYCSVASYTREFTLGEQSRINILIARLRALIGGNGAVNTEGK